MHSTQFPIAFNQPLKLPIFEQYGYRVSVKREDLVFPLASGNKWRKLKYNMEAFHSSTATAILTFGGAFSNHLSATAALCAQENSKCIGIVRGNELQNKPLNPTLTQCHRDGMGLVFVSREEYALKEGGQTVNELASKEDLFIMPEGGTNELAVLGCKEILNPSDDSYDTIVCAVGTGGTLAGLALAAAPHQKVVGFQVVKDASIPVRIRTFVKRENWSLVQHATYRGYAQADAQLVAFATMFLRRTGVLLDPIYTAPMLFQLVQMIKENTWNFGKKILLIHTGGTQGIAGFNSRHGLQWPEG
jgi:1-aminocyclopropane-1-carboxylate deaminase